jgi:hypothetical protein
VQSSKSERVQGSSEDLLLPCPGLASSDLKCKAQSQSNRSPIVYSLLTKAEVSSTKVWIDIHIFRQDNRPALRVQTDVEVTEVDNVVGKRRPQRMIEHVIEIGADLQFGVFIETEELMNAEIHAPSAWSCQKVTLGDLWIVENIGTRTRWRKRSRIKDSIPRQIGVWIAYD